MIRAALERAHKHGDRWLSPAESQSAEEGRYASDGVGGCTIDPQLDAWYHAYMFSSVTSMPVERLLGAIKRTLGEHVTAITQERQLLTLSKPSFALVQPSQYKQYRDTAKQKARERATAVSGIVQKLQALVEEAERAAAAATLEMARRDAAKAEEAARKADRRELTAKRKLVKALKYVGVKRRALVALTAKSTTPVTAASADNMS